MRRRLFLQSAAAACVAAPRIARTQRGQTLKYVPLVPLSALDPIWGANYLTRTHAQMVFDTLYGLDQSFAPHPQMAEGQTVENEGMIWTIRLREGLSFHDGTPVLARDVVGRMRTSRL